MYHWMGPRIALGMGLVIATSSLALCSFITELYWAVAALAVTIGVGPGVLFFCLLFCSWTALPDNKGLATGLTSSSFCLGGTLYGLLFTFLINPDNLSPSVRVTTGTETEYLFPPYVVTRVPDVMRWSAVLGLVIGAVAILLLYDHTSRLERKSIVNSIVSRDSIRKRPEMNGCPTLGIALKTSAFWVLFGVMGLSITYPTFMIVQYKNYGERHIDNDQYLSGIGSIGLVINACARLLCTWLTDFLPYKPVAFTLCFLMSVVACTVTLVAPYHFLYVTWVFISFFGHGSVFAPIAVVCGNIFGTAIGGKVFSLVALGSALALTLLGVVTVPMVQVRTI